MLPIPVEPDGDRRYLCFALVCRYIAEMDLKHWRAKGRRSSRSAGRAGARWAFRAWPHSKWTFLALGLLLGPAATVGGDIVSYAIVQDDATLRVQGKTIRLFGVYPVDLRHFCDDTFRPVRCQTRAAVALASKIQGFVHCDPEVRYHDGTIGAFCSVSGDGVLDPPVDLGAYLIREGWAVALPEAPFEYHTLEKIARAHGRGIWGFQADSIIR
jgi:endonuclease YncB( thermonuclease family)